MRESEARGGIRFAAGSPAGTAQLFSPALTLNVAGRTESGILVALRRRILDMKQILAACVTVAILWATDAEFNDGRYSAVVKGAFNSIVQR